MNKQQQLNSVCFIGRLKRSVVTSSLSLSAQLLTSMLVKSRYPAHKSLLQAAMKANTMDMYFAASSNLWV